MVIISVWVFGFRILLIKDSSYFKVLEILIEEDWLLYECEFLDLRNSNYFMMRCEKYGNIKE